MKKILVATCCLGLALSMTMADAFAYGINKNRDKFSAEQRAKILADGWTLCRKKYVLVERVEVSDYARRSYICWSH